MKNKGQKLDRRQFLSQAALGMASCGVLSLTGNSLIRKTTQRQHEKATTEIIYRRLGKTGIHLPIVNMGVMNAFDGALIKKSFEIGVRHFDTAAYYQNGKNEQMLGAAIKELGVRDKVIIATKVYIPHKQRNMTPQQAKTFFIKTLNQSLKRLQTDYVDILYSHSVDSIDYLNNPGVLEALRELKEQQKVRFVGFSTHKNMTALIKDAVNRSFYDVILTAYNYALHNDKDLVTSLKRAAVKGIGLIAMKTQCAQYWYRQYIPESMHKFYQGKIIHTAVLKWALRNDFITTAIPGYTTFQQMEEDFSVTRDLEYTAEEKEFLKDRNVSYSLGYCTQCHRCVATCPYKVDIPTLMRIHLYATCYSNFYQARHTLDNIPSERNLHVCMSCGTCGASCVNHIDIPERINELKTIYG